jgi:hypothetical protein
MDEVRQILNPKKKKSKCHTKPPSGICKFSPYPSEKSQRSKEADQPRTQALSTTRLAGGKTLVQAGHVSPRFWGITKFLHKGGGLSLFYRSSCRYQFDKVQSMCILTNACNFNEYGLCLSTFRLYFSHHQDKLSVFVYVFFVDCICDVATQDLHAGVFQFHIRQNRKELLGKDL